MPRQTKQLSGLFEGLPFGPDDVPPAFALIQPDIQFQRPSQPGGLQQVRWGWKQWAAITPALHKHITKHGRVDIRKALINAQRVLPKEQRRTDQSLSVATAPSASLDIVRLVTFIAATLAAPPVPAATKRSAFHAPGKEPAFLPAAAEDLPQPAGPTWSSLADGSASKQDIPEAFRKTAPDIQYAGTGSMWGWKQWTAIAPLVQDHIRKQGRDRLASAINQAQKQVLPVDQQKTAKKLAIRCSPSASPAVYDLMLWLYSLPADGSAADPVQAEAEAAVMDDMQALRTFVEKAEAAKAAAVQAGALPVRLVEMSDGQLTSLTGSSPAPAAAPVADDLQAFLNTRIGAFLPGFRAFLKDTLQDMLTPQKDFIAEVVKAAVIEVIGGPAPAASAPPPAQEAAPAPPPEPPEPVEKAAEPVKAEHYIPQQQAAPDPEPLAPAATAPHEEVDEAAVRESFLNGSPAVPEKPAVQPAKVAPHDLESQLAVAAKVLGIPAAPKQTVLVVGLHPKVEQECEKFYGKAFRFVFKRPDAFNCSNDVPASTDIILVHRKTLTKELVQMTRRDNLPVQQVQNNSAAVLGALRDFSPELTHGLHIH